MSVMKYESDCNKIRNESNHTKIISIQQKKLAVPDDDQLNLQKNETYNL